MIWDETRLAGIADEDVVLSLFEDHPDENLATSVFVWLVVDLYRCHEDRTTD